MRSLLEDRSILRSSLQARLKNAVEMECKVKKRFKNDVSVRTVQPWINEMGFPVSKHVQMPLLNKHIKK